MHALLISQFSDFLLAEGQGRTLGVLQINYRLSTWDIASYAVIEDFYLAPEARGRGVARACSSTRARAPRAVVPTSSGQQYNPTIARHAACTRPSALAQPARSSGAASCHSAARPISTRQWPTHKVSNQIL
ncbi:MAG: GNAT family N-acetyltransferase [Kouleothrix sp.]